jgi:hypothetical protein
VITGHLRHLLATELAIVGHLLSVTRHLSTELIVAAGLAIVGHLAAILAVATHLGLLTLLAVTGHLLAATGHLSALLAAELALAAALAIIFTCLPFLYILQNQIGLILSKLPCCYIFIQFSLQLIRIFIERLAVEFSQTVFVSWEVGRYPVHNDADFVLMGFVDQVFEIFRSTVP